MNRRSKKPTVTSRFVGPLPVCCPRRGGAVNVLSPPQLSTFVALQLGPALPLKPEPSGVTAEGGQGGREPPPQGCSVAPKSPLLRPCASGPCPFVARFPPFFCTHRCALTNGCVLTQEAPVGVFGMHYKRPRYTTHPVRSRGSSLARIEADFAAHKAAQDAPHKPGPSARR